MNKSDLPDASDCAQQMKMVIDMRENKDSGWQCAVLTTCAKDGTGVAELSEAFLSHYAFMKENKLLEERTRDFAHHYFKSVLKDVTFEKVDQLLRDSDIFKSALKQIETRKLDPYNAAKDLVETIVKI